MNNIATFYKVLKEVELDESTLKEIKKRLKEKFDILVQLCPHSEAVERKAGMRGMGNQRRCKICGVTDYASEGGTPGDEYDYGFPGHPSKIFWVNAEVEMVSDKEFDSYDRPHYWRVRNGKAVNTI